MQAAEEGRRRSPAVGDIRQSLVGLQVHSVERVGSVIYTSKFVSFESGAMPLAKEGSGRYKTPGPSSSWNILIIRV